MTADDPLTVLTDALTKVLDGDDPTVALPAELDQLAAELAERCPDVDNNLPVRWGIGLLHWFRSHMGPLDVDRFDLAVQWLRPVMAEAPDTLPAQLQQVLADSVGVNRLLDAYYAPLMVESYRRSGDVTVLRAAIARYKRLVPAIRPDDVTNRPIALSNLGAALHMLYEQTSEPQVLDEAVRTARDAVTATALDHHDRPGHLSNLGLILRAKFETTGELSTLEEAVRVGRQAVAAAPPGHPRHGPCLDSLGVSLLRLDELASSSDVLREAVEIHRAAVASIAVDDPARGGLLSNFGLALRRLWQRTGDIALRHETVQIAREAVAANPPGHPNRSASLANLSMSMQILFEWTGELQTLHEAVEIARDVVRTTPRDQANFATHLSDLSRVLQLLFEQVGDIDTLYEAIRAAQEAAEGCPSDRIYRAVYLSHLATAQLRLFDRTGQVPVLEDAIRVSRQAIQALAPDHQLRAVHLSNLGLMLHTLFERTGSVPLLREAVQAARDAVATSGADHIDRVAYLTTLSQGLRRLYLETDERDVLLEAVRTGRDAVASAPADHTQRPKCLDALSSALRTLYERTGELGTLHEAAQSGRDALVSTPVSHPHHPNYATNLGNALLELSMATKQLSVFQEAVQAYQQAVSATSSDHRNRGLCLSNLGLALYGMFMGANEADRLREVVGICREAVDVTPADHPSRATYLSNLGRVLFGLFRHAGDPAVAEESEQAFTTAATMVNADTVIRLRAARDAAELAVLSGDPDRALAMIELAVTLLPRLTSRDLGRVDREYRTGHASGLASTAASVAIAAGQPDRAVELLEQTRGLVYAGTLDTRGDITDLRDRAPLLADEFDTLRMAINAVDHDPGSSEENGSEAYRMLGDRRVRLNEQWQDLVERIRRVPKLDRFLRPLPIAELRQRAAPGPIVYVTVHGGRGHALIVTADYPVRLVDLSTDFTEESAIEQANILHNAINTITDENLSSDDNRATQHRILDVLTWLWDTVTAPVLHDLGYLAPPESEQWTRIWWCPVGIVTNLPLHVAGRHSATPRTDTVMDRVVSSYIPTIRALTNLRATPARKAESMMIVAVPDAPEAVELTGVAKEARLVHELVPSASMLPPHGDTTTREDVLEALPRHQIAHFACHGIVDLTNPAASRLLLHDHLTHPLSLHMITRLRLTEAHLAYLSACSTTDTSQADEATHLTAAFQLAGYRNVIGTLWPINDRLATAIATSVYTQLTRHTTVPDATQTAQALHDTIHRYRDRYPASPTVWAAHTHTGA